ncbi:MAG: cache domain-containing protein [Geminicoccaceae bacterium]
MRSVLMASALALAVAAGSAMAQEFGSADEARAMLEQAVVALEADEAAALAAFTAGEAPFKDRDLYVFCGGPDGLMSAHGADPGLVGRDVRELTDVAGTKFGVAFYESAVEGEFNTVEYLWPRPGGTEPLPKASYVTLVGGQMCGVGYYP